MHLGYRRIQQLCHAAHHLRVLHGQLDGRAQVLIALNVGRYADLAHNVRNNQIQIRTLHIGGTRVLALRLPLGQTTGSMRHRLGPYRLDEHVVRTCSNHLLLKLRRVHRGQQQHQRFLCHGLHVFQHFHGVCAAHKHIHHHHIKVLGVQQRNHPVAVLLGQHAVKPAGFQFFLASLAKSHRIVCNQYSYHFFHSETSFLFLSYLTIFGGVLQYFFTTFCDIFSPCAFRDSIRRS